MTNKSFVSILLSLLLVITLFSSCKKEEISDQTTLHIPPTLCESMLAGVTPAGFCDTEGQGTFLEKKFLQAHVDDDGCLILTLERDIINEWKNTFVAMQVLQCVLGDSRDIGITIDYSKDFMDYMEDAHTCGFEISEDFTKIVASPDDNHWYYPLITWACAMQQIFEEKICTEIKVTYVDVNDDGEVISTTIFPDNTTN